MNKHDILEANVKKVLKALHLAHQRSVEFIGKELMPGTSIEPVDFFEMATAYEEEALLLLKLDLSLADLYPNQYSDRERANLNEEHERVTRRLQAWKRKEFPTIN